MDWTKKRNIQLEFIKPGKPQQNAYIERYNRTIRGECLSQCPAQIASPSINSAASIIRPSTVRAHAKYLQLGGNSAGNARNK